MVLLTVVLASTSVRYYVLFSWAAPVYSGFTELFRKYLNVRFLSSPRRTDPWKSHEKAEKSFPYLLYHIHVRSLILPKSTRCVQAFGDTVPASGQSASVYKLSCPGRASPPSYYKNRVKHRTRRVDRDPTQRCGLKLSRRHLPHQNPHHKEWRHPQSVSLPLFSDISSLGWWGSSVVVYSLIIDSATRFTVLPSWKT